MMVVFSRVAKVMRGDTVVKYIVQTARESTIMDWDAETDNYKTEIMPVMPVEDIYWHTVNRAFKSEAEAKAYAEWVSLPERVVLL